MILFDLIADVAVAQYALPPVGRDDAYELGSGPPIGSAGAVVIADGVFSAD